MLSSDKKSVKKTVAVWCNFPVSLKHMNILWKEKKYIVIIYTGLLEIVEEWRMYPTTVHEEEACCHIFQSLKKWMVCEWECTRKIVLLNELHYSTTALKIFFHTSSFLLLFINYFLTIAKKTKKKCINNNYDGQNHSV